MKKQINTVFMFSLLLITCSAFSQIEKKSFPDNPTSYVFRKNIISVKGTIKEAYFQMGYKGGKIDSAGDAVVLSKYAETIFSNDSNRNDYYFSGGFFSESKTYFRSDRKPLVYFADFHLHLTQVAENQTKVTIYTINPRVQVGKKLFPSLPHFVRQIKTKKVLRTTIEEYQILLAIGQQLGLGSDMPLLKI